MVRAVRGFYQPPISPGMQWPVDPDSLNLQRLPGQGPQLDRTNPQNYGEDNDYLFGDEDNPTRRNGVQSIYSQPPDMAGAFAGGEKLSPAVVQTIIAESLGEGPEGMRLVAETIMNRARERGITPEQVVMEKGQYAGRNARLDNPENVAAATAAWGAAQSPEDPTMGAEYFYSGDTQPTATEDLQAVYEYGNHTFLADRSTVKEMQTNLAAAGLYNGAIDGDFGPATRAAADAFRQQLGTDDPMQALTSLGAEPAAGQEAITNILQQPESLPAFQQTAEAAPASLVDQRAVGVPPVAATGVTVPSPPAAAPAPVPTPASGAGVDATGAPVRYAGDYNDILDNGAPPPAPQPKPAGYGPSQVPDQPGDRSDLTQAGPRYDPLNPQSAATPPNMADPYADFETTRANVRSPDTLRDVMGQAGLDDSQWDAGALGIPSQAISPSNLPPLMQQQYEQAARRDWARPPAPEEAPPQYDTRQEPIQEGQYRIGAPFNAEAEAAEAAAVTKRLAAANPARLLRDEREMASIARTQPIGPPESPNYRIGKGLRPDLQETVGIGGPDAPPTMGTIQQSTDPQAIQEIELTAMPAPPPMSWNDLTSSGGLMPQEIDSIQQQRDNPPAGGIRGWTYDENGRIVAVGAPTASVAAPTPAPATAAQAATEPAAVTPAQTQAPATAGDALSYYGINRGRANLMSGGRMKGERGANLTTITSNGGQKFTVNVDAAPSFLGFVNEMEANGYPVSSSGGYNERKKTSGKGWSEHSYGTAIDINSADNPFQEDFDDGMQTNMPENVSDIAAKWGLTWGGDWNSVKDPMHFEWQGLTEDQVTKAQAATAVTAEAAAATQGLNLANVDVDEDTRTTLTNAAAAAQAAGVTNLDYTPEGGLVGYQVDGSPWTPEQQAAAAVAGGPRLAVQPGQTALSIAPTAPAAEQGYVPAEQPAAAPAATAAPVSTMRDVAMAAHNAGFIGRIDVDPVTNRVSGYNHGMGGKFPNGQPWTAEQKATIAAAVPGIVVDADGGLSLPPAAPAMTSVPAGITGTTEAVAGPVEAKPGGGVQTPVVEAAVPIDTARTDAETPLLNLSAKDRAAKAAATDPYTSAGQSAGGLVDAITGAMSDIPPMQSAPRNPYEVAEETATQLGQDITSGALRTGAGYDPALAGANAPAPVPPPTPIEGQVVSEGPIAPGPEGRVQLTAPAGTQYTTMAGPVVGAGPANVLDTGPPVDGPGLGPPPPIMTGKEKDDYLGPTERMVTTVPIAPGDMTQPLRPMAGEPFNPNAVPMPGSFTPPPMTGKERDDYIGPALAPAPPAPAPARTPGQPIPQTPDVQPPAQTPPVTPKETPTFQQRVEKAGGRSKTFSDPIEYAARTSTTEDGKFDHDKFWQQLGDVDLNQTQQTVAAKTAAQGAFIQNKMPNFLSGLGGALGNVGMPDMPNMSNVINPVRGIGNFIGGLFGGGFDPRSSGIGSDYAASQSPNYSSFGQQGPPGSSGNYGGSYTGPGSGSYGGGGMGGSQYGGGWGGGGGYSGGGSYGGAGGQNIGQGIGGAFRNR